MRLKSLIGIILWGGMLVSCGPDNRVVLAEKLMAEKETDRAIVVMNEMMVGIGECLFFVGD